jgi:O-antigen/teichoic acid export membrane protein
MFAFPLIGYELASVILDSGDRIIVQHYMGAQSLGYYSAAYNVSTYAEEALMVPINLALFPIYMKLWVEKGRNETELFLSRSLNNFIALAIGIVCVVLLTSREAITVLASPKFQEAHRLLPVLVVGLLVYATHIFFNAALLIHKKTSAMTSLVIGACIVNLALNVVLIPRLGLQGAAVATLLSYLSLVFFMAKVSSQLLTLKINYVGFAWNVLAAGLTFGLIYRLHIQTAWLSVIVKGMLAIAMYALLLCVLNSEIRGAVFRFLKRPAKRTDASRSQLVVT